MSDLWQLFLKGVGGNTTIYRVPPDSKVDLLFEKIQADTKIPANELRIIFAGKQLEYKCDKDLSDYRIGNLSTLFMVLRLRGGWFPTKAQKQRLRPLFPFITLTSEQDMLTWDDDPSYSRAKMPCGHAIGPASMTSYCRSVLDQGNFRFYCPYIHPQTNAKCQKEWDYFLVRHVAMMDVDALKEFEAKVSENYLMRQAGIQRCPGCNTYCERSDKSSMRVRCQICTMKLKGGTPFEFCWSCLHSWGMDKNRCQNKECDGRDPRLKYLSTCDKKEVVGVKNCPSVRACPNCGTLINHLAACKHMTCPGCKNQFCFICLDLQQNGKWKCGSYNTPCNVAPIQTQIAGS